MSYRRALLPGFDENLAGDGSQIHNDMQASLRVHAAGWRVVWDPGVLVDHYAAERSDDDKRIDPTRRAVTNVVHQSNVHPPVSLTGWRRIAAFFYPLIVGSRDLPGLILLLGAVPKRSSYGRSLFGFRANWGGHARGLVTFGLHPRCAQAPARLGISSSRRRDEGRSEGETPPRTPLSRNRRARGREGARWNGGTARDPGQGCCMPASA